MHAQALGRRQVIDAPPAHLKAHETDHLPKQGRANARRTASAPMHIDEVAKPRSRRPRLLRVPRPVCAPGLFCPQGTEKHPDSKEGETYPRQVVDGGQVLLLAEKLP